MQDSPPVGHIDLDNAEQISSQRTGNKKLLKTLETPDILLLLDHWNTQTVTQRSNVRR